MRGASSAAKEYTNALSDMPDGALQAGNTAPCHTRQVFRQAASELRGERRLDDNPIREMRIHMASWLAWKPRDRYGAGGYLQAIGDTPFYATFYLKEQVQLYVDACKHDGGCALHLTAQEVW